MFGHGSEDLGRSGRGKIAFLLHTAQTQTGTYAEKDPSTFSGLLSVFSLFFSPKIKLLWQWAEVSVLCLVNEASDAVWSHSVP